MIHFPRWKIALVILVSLFGIFYAAPNLLGGDTTQKMQESLPGWMPGKTVNLGLDLQGGSYLLYQVDIDSVVKVRLEDLLDSYKAALRRNKDDGGNLERIAYVDDRISADGFSLRLRDPAQYRETAYGLAKGLEDGLEVETFDDGTVSVTFSLPKLTEIQTQVISRSIEVVRRRIDETGTREPVIQRQGEDRILIQLPGVDDPQAIKDLVGKTAKMTFHMVDSDVSPEAAYNGSRIPGGSKIVPMLENQAQKVIIRKRALIKGDELVNAQPTFEQGRPVVAFQFNGPGGKRFCDITRKNVGKPFAIVLDDEVISAPVIQGAICQGRGIITGNFTVKEATDLSILLRAGALPADLSVMEERSVGPSLGADSVAAGKTASLVALLLVLVFMWLYYGTFGFFADLALLINVALIFALLSALQATLTLPGIAGIVLTIGMAVDANVLVFERIHEEVKAGRSPISAIDTGYSQALKTIIDANVTTLIAAILLFNFGTGPVKGFAVTLGIGIVTSLFSAITLTRLLVVTWLQTRRPEQLAV